MIDLNSITNIISHLKTANIASFSMNDENQIVYEGNKSHPKETIEKVKNAILSFVKSLPAIPTDPSLNNQIKVLTENKTQLDFLENLQSNPGLAKEIFVTKDVFERFIIEHREFQNKLFESAFKQYNEDLQNNSFNELKDFVKLSDNLASFSDDIKIKERIQKLTYEYNKRHIVRSILEDMPLLNNKIKELNDSDRNALLEFSVKNIEFFSIDHSSFSNALLKNLINLFFKANEHIKLFKNECLKKNIYSSNEEEKYIVYRLIGIYGSDEITLDQILTLIDKLKANIKENPSVLKKNLDLIIKKQDEKSEFTNNLKYILLTHIKFTKENHELPPNPALINSVQQAKLIEKIPEVKFLLKLQAFELLDCYIANPEHLRSVIKLLESLPIDTAKSLLESLKLSKITKVIDRIERNQYNQFVEVLYLISCLPISGSEKAVSCFNSWLNNAHKALVPYTYRFFKDCFLKMEESGFIMSQLLDISKKYKQEKNLEVIRKEIYSVNQELHELIFSKAKRSSFYWNCCKKSLQNYPRLIEPFKAWIRKLTLLDMKDIESWPIAIANTKLEDVLADLFELEQHHPNLFQRILSASIQCNSAKTLEVLVSVFQDYSRASFLIFLELIELDPSLISSNPHLFQDISGFRNDIAILDQLNRFHVSDLQVIFKEKDPERQEAIWFACRDDYKKLRKVLEIEGNDPIFWNNINTSRTMKAFLYEHMRSDFVEYVHQASDTIRQKVKLVYSKVSSRLQDIPVEIFSIDPELITQIHEMNNSINMKLLLEEVVLKGNEAKIYLMLKMSKQSKDAGELFYSFLSDLRLDDPIGEAYSYLFSEDVHTKGLESLSFLNTSEWSQFNNVITNFERIYNLQAKGSVQECLKALPDHCKRDLLFLMHHGLAYPSLINPMCDFIIRNPQGTFFELLHIILMQGFAFNEYYIKAKNIVEASVNLINFLNRMPLKGLALSLTPEKIYSRDCELTVFLFELSQKYSDILPSLLIHILNSYSVEKGPKIAKMLKNNSDLFFSMFEMDKRIGPPYGKIISEKFNEETKSLLASNSEFSNTVRLVGLDQIYLVYFKKLGSLYLYMLQINPNHPGIEPMLSNDKCIEALQSIDWNFVSNPLNCIAHALTIASWDEMDSLIAILNWIGQSHQVFGEHILGMAKAGYLPEAMEVVHEKRSPFESVKKAEAESKSDSEEKTRKTKRMKTDSIKQSSSELAQVASEEVVQGLKSYTDLFWKSGSKEREYETAFTFALANSMITAEGCLSIISFDRLKSFMQGKDSDFAIYLKRIINYLERDKDFATILDRIRITTESNSPTAKIVRRMFGLDENAPINDRHAKVAALSALLSRPRQSHNIGSCYGTSRLIISHSNKEMLKRSLEDYLAILANNALTRVDENENSYEYPVSIPTKKMKESVLDENLLLKSREKILSCMGANASVDNTAFGIISVNLKNNSGYYKRKIEQFTSHVVTPLPIDLNVILDELRKSFVRLTKAIVEYEEPHPITNNLGWWYLSRRDKQQDIRSSAAYQELHSDIVEMARKAILARFPHHEIYLSKLFEYLTGLTRDLSFIRDIDPKDRSKEDSQKDTLWQMDNGGFTEAVLETDLQYIGKKLLVPFKVNSAEEVLHHLVQYCKTMPLQLKGLYIEEQESLITLDFPEHSLCFKPSSLLTPLSKGKSEADIIMEVKRPSGINMSGVDLSEIQSFYVEWCDLIPKHLRIPFMKGVSDIDLDQMSFEEFGAKMMETLEEVSRFKPSFELQVELENVLLGLLKPEMRSKIPLLVLADTNWDAEEYNNKYLSCWRSPLSGTLEWYKSDRYGRKFKRYGESLAGGWSLMQPIIRTDKGHLTYKKLS